MAKHSLSAYQNKRNFKVTAEPPPKVAPSRSANLAFFIQKHDATRLHYDFRLEWQGVLFSWAVTKGPSLNPSEKRLAVRVEDHPLSYGTFEGTIPQGEYGGGTVMLWDVGTWEPQWDPDAGLAKGHLAFTLKGERLHGRWDLVRMHAKPEENSRKENWLLIKVHDEFSRTDAPDFLDRNAFGVKSHRSMQAIGGQAIGSRDSTALDQLVANYPAVQLATPAQYPPIGPAWVHEIKFDGYRLLGFLVDKNVRLLTRNAKDWTEQFPSIAKSLQGLKARNAVLDMEAVFLNPDGKSDFHGLQASLSNDPAAIDAYAFDLLHLNGKNLTPLPLLERKKKLQALLGKDRQESAIRFSDHIVGDGDAMFTHACQMGLEGVISKQSDAAYNPGRQHSWVKSKCGNRQEFIILGSSKSRSGERALGALYLGYRKGEKLRYAGKVGTGFTMQSARDLAGRLSAIATDKPTLPADRTGAVAASEWRSIQWVKPELLCEISFTGWTPDGHIRHPSFQGLREDKDAKEVTAEIPRATPESTAAASDFQGIRITHPDREISSVGHVTKGQLAHYYNAIAPLLLKEIVNRPLSILRCPAGIDDQCFFQRNPGKGLGPDVHPFPFTHKGKKYEYLYVDSEKGILELVQMGAVEFHPWGSKIDSVDTPDRLVFDLDPSPEVPFEALKLAARHTRKKLLEHDLESTLRCTGGKGLHVIALLPGTQKWPEAKALAALIANELVADAPEAYVATMSKAKRAGKIFIDYFRNDSTATAIASYSVRARPGAPVAMPIPWTDLAKIESPNQFTIQKTLKKLKLT